MAAVASAVTTFERLKGAFEQNDMDTCSKLLVDLKIAMTQFPSLQPGVKPCADHVQELLLSREILEIACLTSVKKGDIPAFERHVAHLKTYYNDYGSILPESQRKFPLLGLNLLRLLAQSRIAEFHTEMELLPLEDLSNVYINFPILLEQYLMEGSYKKVLAAKNDAPSDTYDIFLNILLETVRNEIAEASESAYKHIPVANAKDHFMFANESELKSFASDRGWRIVANNVVFQEEEEHKQVQVPSIKMIRETLSYANELERIV